MQAESHVTASRAMGILALGVALFLGPVLLPGTTIADGDLLVFFPYLYDLPWEGVWSPWTGLGAPYLANPQTGFFYPPAWLLAVDYHAFLGPYLFLHLWLGGVGSFLWIRRLTASAEGALLGGLAYALGGPALSLITKLDKLPGYTFLPWLLFGLALLLGSGRVSSPQERQRGLWVGAVAMALTLLGGSVEGVAIAGACALIVTLPGGAGLGRRLAWAGLTLGGGLGLAGMLLVPFLSLLPETARAAGVAAAKGLARSTHPQDLLGWFTHTPFWDLTQKRYLTLTSEGAQRTTFLLSLYGGLPLLAVAGVGALRSWSKPWVRVALLALVAFGALALGQYNPLYRWAYDALPGLSSVRFPEKWWLGTVPFQGLLLAFGWAWLREERKGGLMILLLGLGFGAGGALYWALGWAEGGLGVHVLRQGLIPCLALGAVGFVLVLGERGRLSSLMVLMMVVGIVGGDLLIGGQRLYRFSPTAEAFAPSGSQLAMAAQIKNVPPRYWNEDPRPGIGLPTVPAGAPFIRMIHDISYANTAIGVGVAYVYGMNPLRLASAQGLISYANGADLETRRAILARLGAELWIIWNQERALDVARRMGLRPLPAVEGAPLLVGLLGDPQALERVRWVDEVKWVGDRKEALAALGSGLEPEVVVGIEGDVGAESLKSGGALKGGEAKLRYASSRGGVWSVEYEAEGPGVVVIGEAMAKGWGYRIDDGPRRDASTVDVALMGIPAPGGRHQIEVSYEPPGLAVGIFLSFLSLLGGLGITRRMASG